MNRISFPHTPKCAETFLRKQPPEADNNPYQGCALPRTACPSPLRPACGIPRSAIFRPAMPLPRSSAISLLLTTAGRRHALLLGKPLQRALSPHTPRENILPATNLFPAREPGLQEVQGRDPRLRGIHQNPPGMPTLSRRYETRDFPPGWLPGQASTISCTMFRASGRLPGHHKCTGGKHWVCIGA